MFLIKQTFCLAASGWCCLLAADWLLSLLPRSACCWLGLEAWAGFALTRPAG